MSFAVSQCMTMTEQWPIDDRPRERLLRFGAKQLTNSELLALVIRSGTKEYHALDLASEILKRFDGIKGLVSCEAGELMRIEGIGEARACSIIACVELSRRMVVDIRRGNPTRLQKSKDVYQLLLPRFIGEHQELFYVLALDGRNKIRRQIQIAQGSATSVEVHPREVFAPLIREGAAAAIIAHNHPSGDPSPSADDLALTARLTEVAAIIGIPILDHLIFGASTYVSLADKGMI